MTALGVGVGLLAVLLPLTLINPVVAGAATFAATVGVGLLAAGTASARLTPFTYLATTPFVGVGIALATVGHVDVAAAAADPAAVRRTPLAAGALAGLTGTVALSLLFGSATRTATTPNVRAALVASLRVAALFATASGTLFAVSQAVGETDLGAAFDRIVVGAAAADQGLTSFVVLLAWALVAALAVTLLRSVGRLTTTPLESVDARDPAELAADAESDTETESTGDSDRLSTAVSASLIGLIALSFLQLIGGKLVPTEQDSGLADLLAASDAFGEAVTTETALIALIAAMAALVAIRLVVALAEWARRRHDRSERVLGPTLSSAGVVAAVALGVQAGSPLYRPAVEAELLAAAVPPSLVRELVGVLPALVLGGVAALAAVTAASLVLVRVYAETIAQGPGDWLVYRNLVFLSSAISIVAATVYGVMPLAAFAAMVAALLAWDFLEYGYTLAVELRTGAVQPPEIAHVAASAGVGVVLVGLTLGVHQVGRSFSPPTATSFLAVPLLVLAAALLLLYFNSE
ncbi:DUF7519 family protein [Halorubrum kocurii]|uniref:Uncharacterized protein n=1 Tax=Halorubrum kocurii JCM 14978 TaxID=1230456 RepID=M0NUG4_9EURY|nr:hypothetical protein [Halorubrum kocurii]EMA60889.1 hypothetical protein C468_12497 [Halorubrum kocurii JCM 14978]